MIVLRSLPPWLRRVLVGLNMAASVAVLVHWWVAIWPNLAAAWIGTVPAVAGLSAVLARHLKAHVDRRLDAHGEAVVAQVADHLAEHHERIVQHLITAAGPQDGEPS